MGSMVGARNPFLERERERRFGVLAYALVKIYTGDDDVSQL